MVINNLFLPGHYQGLTDGLSSVVFGRNLGIHLILTFRKSLIEAKVHILKNLLEIFFFGKENIWVGSTNHAFETVNHV